MKNLSRILLLMFCCSYQSLALAITCNANIPESTPSAAFNLGATDGTVVHNPTALMWSRCALGQTWNQGTGACDDGTTAHTWTQALTEANNSTLAGFTDWRLPNIKELSSIVERKCVSPSINETVFPGTPSSFFWAAAAFGGDSKFAWGVFFGDGCDGIGDGNFTLLVRLVRGGQLFDSFTFSIGGMVSGLSGSGLVLQNNGGDNLSITANGSFNFATTLPDGSDYEVTVQTQPSTPSQTCTVGNGSGTLAGADVTNVAVTCADPVFMEDLAIQSLDTPYLELWQVAGSFPQQQWILSANDLYFRIEDLTNASMPFTIGAGAPTASLRIAPSGNLGFGASPLQRLHAFENANANTLMIVHNPNPGTSSAAGIGTVSDAAVISFTAHASARTLARFGETLGGWGEMLLAQGDGFALGTLGNVPLVLGANNKERLRATGSGVQVFGSFTTSSSRELKQDVGELDGNDALRALAELQAMKFKYQGQSEENLGFIAEEVPDLVAVQGRNSIAPMDMIALLTKVVQQQRKALEDRAAVLSKQQRRIGILQEQLGRLQRAQ